MVFAVASTWEGLVGDPTAAPVPAADAAPPRPPPYPAAFADLGPVTNQNPKTSVAGRRTENLGGAVNLSALEVLTCNAIMQISAP